MNSIKFKRPVPTNPLVNFIDDFFHKGMNELAHSDLSLSRPGVNILEHDDNFIIELAAPGLHKEDFDIKVNKDQLVVKVVQEAPSEENEKKGPKYRRREFNYNSFSRSFHLPQTVDKSAIDATYTNGILSIALNKKEEAKEKGPITVAIK